MSETYVKRTCARLAAVESGGQREVGSAPLSTFRSERAYVLLGDAGAGKSIEFRHECEELGDAALLRSARDFVTFDVRSEWRDKTIFIDGLDEIRAGMADGRPALDEIRKRLDQLGWPKYRISCREADWLGSNDRRSLERATPGEEVAVFRLEPLDGAAQRELLALHLDEYDLQAFTSGDPHGDISAMLINPLTLELLARAFVHGGSSWPKNRLDTFDLACRQMAWERNDEHASASTSRALEEVLDAAGELCAIQLLSGNEGFSVNRLEDQPAYVALDALEGDGVDGPDRRLSGWRDALRTKLFSAVPDAAAVTSNSRFVPLHRHIAEYLGGRFLARLVGEGIPARRLVALMASPHDGRVVTSLRGLSAWFAAHSREALDRLVDADPVGIGLYGDIGWLNGEQKRRLLRALASYAAEGPLLGSERRDGRRLDFRDTTAWAFRSIIDAETFETVTDLLAGSPQDITSERVTEFLLQCLAVVGEDQFDVVRELVPHVSDVVRNGGHSRRARLAALDAQIHLTSAGPEAQRGLRELLDDITANRVSDPDRQLAGRLLEVLYPGAIQPAEVWGYAAHPSRKRIIGIFEGFWDRKLTAHSSAAQAGELLDSLHRDASRVLPILRSRYFDRAAVELLATALVELGDEIDESRLFSWLSVTGDCEPEVMPARSAASRRVRDWLEARPDVQRQVFLRWLRVRDPNDLLTLEFHGRCLALHGSSLPSDFGRWCLECAAELAESDLDLARELVRFAHGALDNPEVNDGLTADALRRAVSDFDPLTELVEALLAPVSPDPKVEQWLKERDERRATWVDETRRRAEQWADGLRSGESELRNNTFSSVNLHALALAYMGLYADSDDGLDERTRLSEFIGGEADLVEAVLQAFRESVRRPELPSVDETITLHNESKHAWLALPTLVGLRLLDDEDPAQLDQLDDGLKRQALALVFCVPTDMSSLPPWVERWFVENRSLVTEVATRCAAAAIRSGDEHPPGLNELDTLGGDQGVTLQLLASFPLRGSNAQLRLLERLLLATLANPETPGLRELIDSKLNLVSMTVAQRARWLTAAALAFEDRYVHELAQHVGSHRSAVRHIAEFFHSAPDAHGSRWPELIARLSPGTLAMLIQTLGRSFQPLDLDGLVTVEIDAADRIRAMIHLLAQMPDDEAAEALRHLEHHPDLTEWHDLLRWKREEQSAIQRDAEYRHPTIHDVQRTLSGGAPANAADLAALLLDRLDDIADEMRGDAGNPWRAYWNVDAHGRPTAPRPENACRDSLLTLLRNHPSLRELEVEPEGSYAAGTRADIRASCGGFNVPIEIKRESHRDLWHAMRRQLIGQYTTDPATDGYGIYLVFWFGGEDVPPPSSGRRPGSPQELTEMLEENLSADEARKIAVRVIDVTKPGA